MNDTNRGVTPPDSSTDVGKVRFIIGDISYSPVEPSEVGYGVYENFSDEEIQAFLTAGSGSATRAAGYAYLRFASLAAAGAISWKSDDLSLDSKQVASEYRLLARTQFEQADREEELAASGFALDHIYNTPDAPWDGSTTPEAAPRWW